VSDDDETAVDERRLGMWMLDDDEDDCTGLNPSLIVVIAVMSSARGRMDGVCIFIKNFLSILYNCRYSSYSRCI